MLEFQNISKSFSGVKVLHNISLKLKRGKLVALLGENGAGKSTLMKILCGILPDYDGKILLNGSEVKFSNPRKAENAGIAIIHQELNLVPDLDVAENIFLGREPVNNLGFVNYKKMYAETITLLAQFSFPFSVKTKVRNLPIGWQQMVEIAKSLRLKAEIIVMDEPTSALSESEIQFLFEKIMNLKEKGKTIIYISHRMKEIFQLADEAIILRDGKYQGKYSLADVDQNFLVKKMIGKEIRINSNNRAISFNKNLLSLTSVSVFENKKKLLSEITFQLRQGEVLGIAGLLGAGRTELLKFLYGNYSQSSEGKIEFMSKPFTPSSPVKSIKNRIVYLSEDRKNEGLFPELSNLKNSSVSILPSLSHIGFIKNKTEKNIVSSQVEKLNIKMESLHQHIRNLSGGNQQKVLLSRALLIAPKILLLDESTRGIDVGAKQEIYELIDKLKKDGVGIIFTSSEIPELLQVSDKILVLSEGRQTALLETNKTDSQEILNYAFGGTA